MRARAKERKRERRQGCFSAAFILTPPSKARGPRPAIRLIACVISETHKDGRRLQQKIRLTSCGKLAALPTGNDTDLKDFIGCKPVFVSKVLWVVTPCGWVIAFRSFEVTNCFNLQNYEFANWLIAVKTEAVNFFKKSQRNCPRTRRNNPENMVLQQSLGGELKTLLSYG